MTVGGLLPGFSTKALQSTLDLAVARTRAEPLWRAGGNSPVRYSPVQTPRRGQHHPGCSAWHRHGGIYGFWRPVRRSKRSSRLLRRSTQRCRPPASTRRMSSNSARSSFLTRRPLIAPTVLLLAETVRIPSLRRLPGRPVAPHLSPFERDARDRSRRTTTSSSEGTRACTAPCTRGRSNCGRRRASGSRRKGPVRRATPTAPGRRHTRAP